jgi:hypothetical protein
MSFAPQGEEMTMSKLTVSAAWQRTASDTVPVHPSLIREGKAVTTLLRIVLLLGCLIALIGLVSAPATNGAAYAQQCPNGQCPPE